MAIADDTALSEAAQQKLIAHLNAKAPHIKCPVCATNKFTTGGHLLSGTIFSPNGGMILGGTAYPMAFLVCQNCFHVLQFAAIPIGLTGSQPDIIPNPDPNG